MNVSDFLCYPARIEYDAEADAYAVFVRHSNGEWATSGSTYEEALDMAFSVIYDSAEYLALKKTIPACGKHQDGDVDISLPYDLALKFMLVNAMLEKQLGVIDIARYLGCSPYKAARLLNFDRVTRLDDLGAIFRLVGRPLIIGC